MPLEMKRLLVQAERESVRILPMPVPHGSWVMVSFRVARPQSLPPAVTPAEAEVAGLVVLGLSNAQIAQERGSASRTVANQLTSLFHKCGVRNRTELVARLCQP